MSILVILFCNNVFSGKRLHLALQIAGLFLFLIISFSRFQYFNLHFSSLKLCFTNLVLEIQDNLSLIFLSSLEISNLIYFTHFRLSPIIMGHISSPGLSNMPKFNKSKNNSGFDFRATFRLVRSGVLGDL